MDEQPGPKGCAWWLAVGDGSSLPPLEQSAQARDRITAMVTARAV
ncbi:hypothetical protein ACFOSC_08640 [Streptantibioticus rubrisoli]|nr:hypothetical protein [Streptantibioticus rubrisoli]